MATEVRCLEQFPAQLFRDKNGPIDIKYAVLNSAAAAANVALVTAVTGKKLRVIGLDGFCDVAAGTYITWRDGNGGATLGFSALPPLTASPRVPILIPSGIIETSAGNGLYINVAAAGAAIGTVVYIAYTP